jgi:hypothetical protein
LFKTVNEVLDVKLFINIFESIKESNVFIRLKVTNEMFVLTTSVSIIQRSRFMSFINKLSIIVLVDEILSQEILSEMILILEINVIDIFDIDNVFVAVEGINFIYSISVFSESILKLLAILLSKEILLDKISAQLILFKVILFVEIKLDTIVEQNILSDKFDLKVLSLSIIISLLTINLFVRMDRFVFSLIIKLSLISR